MQKCELTLLYCALCTSVWCSHEAKKPHQLTSLVLTLWHHPDMQNIRLNIFYQNLTFDELEVNFSLVQKLIKIIVFWCRFFAEIAGRCKIKGELNDLASFYTVWELFPSLHLPRKNWHLGELQTKGIWTVLHLPLFMFSDGLQSYRKTSSWPPATYSKQLLLTLDVFCARISLMRKLLLTYFKTTNFNFPENFFSKFFKCLFFNLF